MERSASSWTTKKVRIAKYSYKLNTATRGGEGCYSGVDLSMQGFLDRAPDTSGYQPIDRTGE